MIPRQFGELPEHATVRYEYAAKHVDRDEKQAIYDEARLVVAACEIGTVVEVVAGALALAQDRGYRAGHGRATADGSEIRSAGFRCAAAELRKQASELDRQAAQASGERD